MLTLCLTKKAIVAVVVKAALGILKVFNFIAEYSCTIYSFKFPHSKQINGLWSQLTLIDAMPKTKPQSIVELTR